MKDLAPSIYRQRLLIEGIYSIKVDEKVILDYYDRILRELSLTTYKDPIIHSSDGVGKVENQGFEAFVPLIESGIALYTWDKDKLLSIVIFTCKKFDEKKAIRVTSDFFGVDEVQYRSF